MNYLNVLLLTLVYSGFGLFSFFPSLLSIPNSVATGVFRAVILLLCLSVITFSIVTKNFNIRKKVIPVLAVLLLYILQLYTDLLYTSLPFGRPPFEIFLLSLLLLVIPLLASLFVRFNEKEILLFSRNVLYINTIVASLALLFGYLYGYQHRLSGNNILNPITLGHVAVTGLIISVYFLKFVDNRNRPTLFYLLCSMGVCFVTLILSASRGPLLSLIFVVCFIYFVNSKKRNQSIVTLIFILLTGTLSVFLMEDYFGSLTSRFSVNLGDESSDGEARVFLWIFALDKFLQAPLLGISTTTEHGYVHNVILEILMSTGTIGMLFFLYTFFANYVKTKNGISENKIDVIFGLLFLQYFSGAFFSGTVYSNELMWISAVLVYSLNNNVNYSVKFSGN